MQAAVPVIQFQEPQIHLLAVRNVVNDVINPAFSVEGVQSYCQRPAQTEPWCHTWLGNPCGSACSRMCKVKNALEILNKVDADVITFESGPAPAARISKLWQDHRDKKIASA
jgi:hypothetical protein